MKRPQYIGHITVIDVFNDLGFEPIPEDTWSVGAAARNLYEEIVGQPPPLELRKKTTGSGSHCFAVYPSSWRPRLESIVKSVAKLKAHQLKLI